MMAFNFHKMFSCHIYIQGRAPLLFVILQLSPVLIWMNATWKQNNPQRPKNKPWNSLPCFTSLSITSHLFSLYLSFQTDQTRALDYQRHQNKKNKGCECCAWDFIILGKSCQIWFLPIEGWV